MKIWELNTQYKVQIDVRNNEDYYSYFDSQFKGNPVKEWKEIEMHINKGKGNPCDILYFVSGKPIMSMKAIDVISPLVGKDIEVLPLKLEDFPIRAVNVLNVVDGIDHEHSEAKRLSDGTFVGYNRYVFKLDVVTGHHIFKIPEQLSTRIFVSDQFKELIEQHKLTGFSFIEVWDSEKSNEPQTYTTQHLDDIVDQKEYTYAEAMDIVEQGEWAVVNGLVKWQKSKDGKILRGYEMPDGTYKWTDLIYVPIPYLSMMWKVARRSDI